MSQQRAADQEPQRHARVARIPTSTALFRSLVLDSTVEGIFSVDHRFRITTFNAAAERLTGVPRYRAVGRRCYEVFFSERCRKGCPLRHTLETGAANSEVRLIARLGDESRTTLRVSTSPIRDPAGRVVGAVEVIRTGSSEAAPPKEPLLPRRATGRRRPSTEAILAADPHDEDRQHGSLEAQRLADMLQVHGWRRADTARALGISRATLWRRMTEFGLIE